ncbi:hypothetical protein CC78DRAFT_531022 [Lojkania enalia]|uniref:Uncharacterized protein n=1 Tax=Lojkania enalia TaxID=147567 RepID=A0A9P4N5L9_9PLEO|nr:hypothetical protein CC78DRAFT_531022 [Didymosphaeria enalia]
MLQAFYLSENSLTDSLELKCGALDLLKTLQPLGKKIVVITEGPQDAQERTARALGTENYVNFLATTNAFGLSKTRKLFAKARDRLQIDANMTYIDDNEQHHMVLKV